MSLVQQRSQVLTESGRPSKCTLVWANPLKLSVFSPSRKEALELPWKPTWRSSIIWRRRICRTVAWNTLPQSTLAILFTHRQITSITLLCATSGTVSKNHSLPSSWNFLSTAIWRGTISLSQLSANGIGLFFQNWSKGRSTVIERILWNIPQLISLRAGIESCWTERFTSQLQATKSS